MAFGKGEEIVILFYIIRVSNPVNRIDSIGEGNVLEDAILGVPNDNDAIV